VHTAAPVRVNLKTMETLSAVLRFEELHRALIHHTPARLLVTKAFVQPIIHAVVKGIRVGAGNTVRLLPHMRAQRSRKRVAPTGPAVALWAHTSVHAWERHNG
jgi:hypothetical protein